MTYCSYLLTERGSQREGTIWIVAHNPTRKFHAEDARVMQRIAVFTATALHLARMAEDAKADASEQKLLLHEFDHRVKNTLAMTVYAARRTMPRHWLDELPPVELEA
ncbi:MAG: Histidine kinase [Rhodospirillales bacterium]|nr:Histidine kinase [Rhodospirillales bacterium]